LVLLSGRIRAGERCLAEPDKGVHDVAQDRVPGGRAIDSTCRGIHSAGGRVPQDQELIVPEQTRVSDIGKVDSDAHGCPACPHPAQGPIVLGSPTVMVNSLPAARVDDLGIHAVCCGPNIYNATKGSGTVFINGKAAHRKGDDQQHCGGKGASDMGSSDVFSGD